jgi:hypothetical protein
MRINGREKQFRDISGDISSPPPKIISHYLNINVTSYLKITDIKIFQNIYLILLNKHKY